MSKDNSSHNSSAPQPVYYQTDEDEISLGELFLSLWRNRSTIAVYSFLAIFLVSLLCVGLYFSQEKYKVSSQEFKIEFEGIDQNRYPSGLKFSTADILSTPVLRKVYQQKKLETYFDFADFKSSLAITQTNDKIELLEYEYAAKLSDKKLSIDERKKLETMFLEKKKNDLIPVYTLSFRTDNTLTGPSKTFTSEILSDILATWADDADRNKGANKYQLFLISPNSLNKEKLEQEDYLIAANILRENIQRIKKDIQKVMNIPGSSSIRTKDTNISLQDLAFRLEDLQNFSLNQMVGLLRETGISKDRTRTAGYLKSKIFDLNLDKRRAQASLAVYQSSLQQYMSTEGVAGEGTTKPDATTAALLQQKMGHDVTSVIPQFSGSFLDNLQKMSEKNSDNAYRQKIIDNVIQSGLKEVDIEKELQWYNELLAKTNTTSKEDSSSTQNVKLLDQIFEETYSSMLQTIKDMNNIYLELSKHNLNPASILYTQTEPALHSTDSSMGLKKIGMIAILTLLIAEGVIFITILVQEGLRAKREEKE